MTALLVLATSLALAPPEPIAPEAKEQAKDLRAAGEYDADYPIPQDEALSKKLRTSNRLWFHDQFVTAFEKRGDAKAKGHKQTIAALEATSIYYCDYATFSRRRAAWDHSCELLEKAKAAGGNDAVVKLFYMMQYGTAKTPEAAVTALKPILQELDNAKAPAYLRYVARMLNANAMLAAAKDDEKAMVAVRGELKLVIAALAELASDKTAVNIGLVRSYATTLEKELISAGWIRDKAHEDIVAAFEKAGATKATLKAHRGSHLVTAAWAARGIGLADTVSPDGYATFEEKLRAAETAFTEAYELDPTCDWAPTSIIAVCMGLGKDRNEMETWFQRAMKANPDNHRACSMKMTFLEPKWGGTEEAVQAFGRQCLRTKNVASGIPHMIMFRHRVRKLDLLKEYLAKMPLAWGDAREYYEMALADSPKDRQMQTEYALWCAAAEEWPAAGKLVKMIGDKPALTTIITKEDYEAFKKLVDEKNKP